MGEVLSVLGAAEQMKSAYDQMRGPTPQAAPLADAGSMLPQMPGQNGPVSTPMPQAEAPAASGAGASMMSTLLGQQPQQQASDAPPPPPQQVDNPYAADTPKELAQQDIVVQGDNWRPKKENLLGQIGDALLMMRGQRPIFRERTDAANLKDAMQGFQKDPETAISRVRQVDPDAAWKMYQDESGIRANEALEAQRKLGTMNATGNVLGSMLETIQSSKTPDAIYSKVLPTMRQYAEAGGYPADMLPDTYDADKIGTLASQGLSVYQSRRLKQYQQSIQNTNAYRGARLGQMQQGLEQQAGHYAATEGETNRHNQAMEQNSSKATTVVKTKYGPGLVSADGNQMQIRGPDGKTYLYLKSGDNTWQLFKKPEEKKQ